MCGRYASSRDPEELLEELEASGLPVVPLEEQVAEQLRPSYNVAPTKPVATLVHAPDHSAGGDAEAVDPAASGSTGAAGAARLLALSWGLVPSWAKDRKSGTRMINARLEGVTAKPAYRSLVRKRRCLLPADGWYEWQAVPAERTGGRARKQPFYLTLGEPGVLTFAGLYTWWRDPAVADDDDPTAWLGSTTILTTAAEPGLDAVHDRMPVVLPAERWRAWLDPETPKEDALGLATGLPGGRFTAVPVGTAVGNVRNDDPSLRDPAPVATLAGVVNPATGELYA